MFLPRSSRDSDRLHGTGFGRALYGRSATKKFGIIIASKFDEDDACSLPLSVALPKQSGIRTGNQGRRLRGGFMGICDFDSCATAAEETG